MPLRSIYKNSSISTLAKNDELDVKGIVNCKNKN